MAQITRLGEVIGAGDDPVVRDHYEREAARFRARPAVQALLAQVERERVALGEQGRRKPAYCYRCGSTDVQGEYCYAPSREVPVVKYWFCGEGDCGLKMEAYDAGISALPE